MKNKENNTNKTNPRMNPEQEGAMKNTMTAKGLVIAWIGIAALIGCTNALAQDLEVNRNNVQGAQMPRGNNGDVLIVSTVAALYTFTPCLTAPIAIAANATVGMLAGAIMPAKAENTGKLDIAAQVAANKALAEKLTANKVAANK
jgi:hypothetical protein